MQLKDTLIGLIDLHKIVVDSISLDNGDEKNKAIEELKKYTTSTYTPVTQLAKAILKLSGGENLGFVREQYIRLLEHHDSFRAATIAVSGMSDGQDTLKLVVGKEFGKMLETYSSLHEVVAEVSGTGNRGDLMVVDVILTSLGMADEMSEE